MNSIFFATMLLSSSLAAAQTPVKCADYTRSRMRIGSVVTDETHVTFTLQGGELWGGEEDSYGIDLVTTDGRDIGVTNNEPGATFKVTFPKSVCQFDGSSTLCQAPDQDVTFTYWPFNVNPRREVTFTVDSNHTTAVLASGRISLLMVMRRPNGSTSFQNISYSCTQ